MIFVAMSSEMPSMHGLGLHLVIPTAHDVITGPPVKVIGISRSIRLSLMR